MMRSWQQNEDGEDDADADDGKHHDANGQRRRKKQTLEDITQVTYFVRQAPPPFPFLVDLTPSTPNTSYSPSPFFSARDRQVLCRMRLPGCWAAPTTSAHVKSRPRAASAGTAAVSATMTTRTIRSIGTAS
jgi:hypothetical protein